MHGKAFIRNSKSIYIKLTGHMLPTVLVDFLRCGGILRKLKYHNLLMKLSSDYPEIKRPDRFGSGTYMTIANVDINELLVDGFLDMERIVERLHEYEQLVSKCAEIVNSKN